MENQFPVSPDGRAKALAAEVAALRRQLEATEGEHRFRNLLAIVRSIFGRTLASGGTIEEIADHFPGRLDAIGRHQLAAVGKLPGTDLEQLVRDELRDFQFGDAPEIAVGGPEVRIATDTAPLLALAMHELVTNAIKFGALSGESGGGHLDIAWRATADGVLIEWRESGVGVVAPAPLRRGFGREFIEQALPYQVGATTGFELLPGGVHCTIRLPAAAASQQPGRAEAC